MKKSLILLYYGGNFIIFLYTMANRTRVKKVLIIIVIAIFLVVTFGTFVMYLVSGDKWQQQPVHNEVQPTATIQTGEESSAETEIAITTTGNNEVVTGN